MTADADYLKEEVLRFLVEPLDEIAYEFVRRFGEAGFELRVYKVHWGDGEIILHFNELRQPPSSDQIKDVIFKIYEDRWGGKPTGMDCVYGLGERQSVLLLCLIIWPDVTKKWLASTSRSQVPSGRPFYGKICILDKVDYTRWKFFRSHGVAALPDVVNWREQSQLIKDSNLWAVEKGRRALYEAWKNIPLK
jgi:hypothetical protein